MIRTAVITRVFLEWKLKITCRKILLKELLMNGVAQYTFSIIFNHLSYSGPPQANLPSSSPIFIFYPSLFPLSPSICPSFIFHYFSFLVSQPFVSYSPWAFVTSAIHQSTHIAYLLGFGPLFSSFHYSVWRWVLIRNIVCPFPPWVLLDPLSFFFVAANFLVPYSTLKHHKTG